MFNLTSSFWTLINTINEIGICDELKQSECYQTFAKAVELGTPIILHKSTLGIHDSIDEYIIFNDLNELFYKSKEILENTYQHENAKKIEKVIQLIIDMIQFERAMDSFNI